MAAAPQQRRHSRRARLLRALVAAGVLCASVADAAGEAAAAQFAGFWEPRPRARYGSLVATLAAPEVRRKGGSLPECTFAFTPPAGAPALGPVRSLCVVGERHSGTNFVSALLDANFAFGDTGLVPHARLLDPVGRLPPRPGRIGHGCTAHKHAAQGDASAAPLAPGTATEERPDADTFLAVFVTRNAFDWRVAAARCVRAMRARADASTTWVRRFLQGAAHGIAAMGNDAVGRTGGCTRRQRVGAPDGVPDDALAARRGQHEPRGRSHARARDARCEAHRLGCAAMAPRGVAAVRVPAVWRRRRCRRVAGCTRALLRAAPKRRGGTRMGAATQPPGRRRCLPFRHVARRRRCRWCVPSKPMRADWAVCGSYIRARQALRRWRCRP